jgi:hypothetical protein
MILPLGLINSAYLHECKHSPTTNDEDSDEASGDHVPCRLVHDEENDAKKECDDGKRECGDGSVPHRIAAVGSKRAPKHRARPIVAPVASRTSWIQESSAGV